MQSGVITQQQLIKNNYYMGGASLLVLCLLLTLNLAHIIPKSQIMLYPNTQNSPSLYMLSFQTEITLQPKEYMLLVMDWLSTPINPYNCLLINSSIAIRCTNLATPTFPLSFNVAAITAYNPQLLTTRTLLVQATQGLPAGVVYQLQIALLNVVDNMKKISPSIEIYTLNRDGLVHQENLNFGPVAYKPPITDILSVSIYSNIFNLAQGVPGQLVTLKAQVQISVPVTTPLSSMFFVLKHPFQFSSSSYLRVDEAEQYGTNPIQLNSKPEIYSWKVLSPHVFEAVFNESFLGGRKFIVQIFEIQNPFFLADSNVSIYSANFNSLTPLEAFQSLLPIKTVTQTLPEMQLGLPFDMPMDGPCQFYRNQQNYYQVRFKMPLTVPQGYAIRIVASQNSILEGTAYADFQSLNYTVVYEYFGSNSFLIRQMGPIEKSTYITIIFKAAKDSITNFDVSVYIDTQAIISAFTATSYMFFGRASDQAVDSFSFYNNIYTYHTCCSYESQRISTTMNSSDAFVISLYPTGSATTSSGAYLEVYLSPEVIKEAVFNQLTGCRFNNVPNSANCTVMKTANSFYIKVNSSDSYRLSNPNAIPFNTVTSVWIYNIRLPRPSSPRYPYMAYLRLISSSALGAAAYIQPITMNVMPMRNSVTKVTMEQHGNVGNTGLLYPGFVRIQSVALANGSYEMAYVLQENEERVISVFSNNGFRGIKAYKNQDQYPCTSNTLVKCIYRRGIIDPGTNRFVQLQHIDVFFLPGSTQSSSNFQVIIPDSLTSGNYQFYYMIGIYNRLTKDYNYIYRGADYARGGVVGVGAADTTMSVDLEGKAGSYRRNVTVSMNFGAINNGDLAYVGITSNWSLFENGKSSYTTSTAASSNPQFFTGHRGPLSVLMDNGMYLSIIPFNLVSGLTNSDFYLDNLHMPYHYDLPSYYIALYGNTQNDLRRSNQFVMTNKGVFYDTYLRSLTIACNENYLGVQNTLCMISFVTQNPLRANGMVTFVFSGMEVATNVCSLVLANGTALDSTCQSTFDNKNVTISLSNTWGTYQYEPQVFTATINGLSINADQISQSVTAYIIDSTGQYVIEKGTRILTTTVARPAAIQIYEITYLYSSPLSANKISIRFFLPRAIYSNQRLGFIMGKDLSDVNLEIKRLRIVLRRSDNVSLEFTNQLISAEYKVLFTFFDASMLIPNNYTLEIYGIMTPVSHQNGAFSIIYQRNLDKAFTLTNAISTSFPTFTQRISSNITLNSYFNTQGYEQTLELTLLNTQKTVTASMVWVVNFPSYYSERLFNHNPYCLIDTTPVQCMADPNTPYQLIIRNSPKIIPNNTVYKIYVNRLACPRGKYTNDYYRSRYMFVGVLQTPTASAYCETALLYPQQAIQTYVNGILTIAKVDVDTIDLFTFSSIFARFTLVSNVALPANSYMYLIFPSAFDNFNNNPMNIIVKVNNVIQFSAVAAVTDRTLELLLTTALAANVRFVLEFPSVPTPKTPGPVQMSSLIGYVAANDRKSIICASAVSGNSAPVLNFVSAGRYLSFNSDNTIVITAGTYSQMIDLKSSDNNRFLSNIVVNVSSPGFVFEPSSIFLRLGDQKGQFRIGADAGLFPISYIYQSTKSEQGLLYYTITTNNNIRVTNTPVTVTIPSTISVPIGGCSQPFVVDVGNPPLNDVSISYNYDNRAYGEDIFWPNYHVTKSVLQFNNTVTTRLVSFCVAGNFGGLGLANSFTMKFMFSGTNYRSYQFTPSENVTINIVPATPVAAPSFTIALINKQKTFLDFNLSLSVPGIVYYSLKLGHDQPAMDLVRLQVLLKNAQSIVASMADNMNYLYVDERDERVGIRVRLTNGVFTIREGDLLAERKYTFCAYLQTFYSVTSAPSCMNVDTQGWGRIMKAKLSFSSALNSLNLNKVLCFFTKSVATEAKYMLTLQSNSCGNRAVSNVYFRYPGQTFSNQNQATNIYMITNPYISTDPSPTSFITMFQGTGQLSSASRSSALSDFAISFLSANFQTSFDALSMTSSSNPDGITVSFPDPEYLPASSTITVNNIQLSQPGSIYFVLVLYKQVQIDGNNTYVRIRLNQPPSQQQIINCLNWQNNPAQGCARAVYSYAPIGLSFPNVQPNSMYMLYYVIASEYPLRPILATSVKSNTVVTFVWEAWLGVMVVGVLLGLL